MNVYRTAVITYGRNTAVRYTFISQVYECDIISHFYSFKNIYYTMLLKGFYFK